MVEFLQIPPHVFEHILNCDVHLLHDSLINVSYYLLDHFELLEQFATGFEHILGKDVFLTVHPEVGESFLGGVKNFSEVAKASFFVENFVSFGKLLPVLSCGAHRLESLA